MTALIDRSRRRAEDDGDVTSFGDWVRLLSSNNLGSLLATTMTPQREVVDPSFSGFTAGLFLRNPIVFACLVIKARLFSEARFQWQQLRGGRPGNLFGTADLAMLDRPERGKTTGDLLTMATFDADLGGNSFHAARPDGIRRLRPDWMTVAYGSRSGDELPSWDPDAEVIGYGFEPNGPGAGEMRIFMADEIAHYAPIPNPIMRNMGVSPLNALLREIMADNAATTHKLSFFENSAPQPLGAKILTPAGWSTMGAVNVGDRVIGRDGRPHVVLGVYPKGDLPIYRVTFTDGASTECSADHIWQVSSIADRQRGVTRTMTTAAILAGGVTYDSGPTKWAVPLPDPVEFDAAGPLPVDPYLLGLLLGDGSFRNGAITFSTADPELVDAIRELLPETVEIRHLKEYEYHLRAGDRGTRSNPLVSAIRTLGLWDVPGYDKSIPAVYMRASIVERTALLQGLIDTDGHVERSASIRFANTSEKLVRQLAELAGSLGARARVARINDREGQPNRRPQWEVRISRLPDGIVPCRLGRKVADYRPTQRVARVRHIASIVPVGVKPAQCIYLDSEEHLYVTDDFVVTHNTPNLGIKVPASMDKTKAEEWIDLFEDAHRGALNAYKAVYFAGGLEPEPLGTNMQQMTFAELQGKVETRVASVLGIHPVVAALSEGLQGSSLNSGNFASAARLVGDATLRPSWRNFAGAFETLLRPLASTRLWYDDRDIPFLRGDQKDAAEIMKSLTTALRTLADGGWDPDTAVDAVTSGDLRQLIGNHSGLLSVQMQTPGAEPAAGPSAMAATAWRVRGHEVGEQLERERIRESIVELTGGATRVRAIREFTAWAGPDDAGARISLGELEGITIRAGAEVPAWNPVVTAFPSLFEPVAEASPARPVVSQVVTRSEVVATRDRLRREGRAYGQDAIAAELGIARSTVRRRLAPVAPAT